MKPDPIIAYWVSDAVRVTPTPTGGYAASVPCNGSFGSRHSWCHDRFQPAPPPDRRLRLHRVPARTHPTIRHAPVPLPACLDVSADGARGRGGPDRRVAGRVGAGGRAGSCVASIVGGARAAGRREARTRRSDREARPDGRTPLLDRRQDRHRSRGDRAVRRHVAIRRDEAAAERVGGRAPGPRRPDPHARHGQRLHADPDRRRSHPARLRDRPAVARHGRADRDLSCADRRDRRTRDRRHHQHHPSRAAPPDRQRRARRRDRGTRPRAAEPRVDAERRARRERDVQPDGLRFAIDPADRHDDRHPLHRCRDRPADAFPVAAAGAARRAQCVARQLARAVGLRAWRPDQSAAVPVGHRRPHAGRRYAGPAVRLHARAVCDQRIERRKPLFAGAAGGAVEEALRRRDADGTARQRRHVQVDQRHGGR